MPTVLLTANPLYGSSNQNVDARLAVNPAYTTVDGQPQCANDSVTLTVPSPAYEIADAVPAESAEYACIAIASERFDHEKHDGDPRYAGYVAATAHAHGNTTQLTPDLNDKANGNGAIYVGGSAPRTTPALVQLTPNVMYQPAHTERQRPNSSSQRQAAAYDADGGYCEAADMYDGKVDDGDPDGGYQEIDFQQQPSSFAAGAEEFEGFGSAIADAVPAESADYAYIASSGLNHVERDGDPRYAGYVAPSQLQIQTNTTALTGKLPVGTNNHYDVGVRRAKKDAAPLQLNDAYGNAEYAFIEEDYC